MDLYNTGPAQLLRTAVQDHVDLCQQIDRDVSVRFVYTI